MFWHGVRKIPFSTTNIIHKFGEAAGTAVRHNGRCMSAVFQRVRRRSGARLLVKVVGLCVDCSDGVQRRVPRCKLLRDKRLLLGLLLESWCLRGSLWNRAADT